MALAIAFTYLETKGLTLEQIDQRFQGVPRDQIDNIIEVYHGEKPVSDNELGKSREKEVTETKAV